MNHFNENYNRVLTVNNLLNSLQNETSRGFVFVKSSTERHFVSYSEMYQNACTLLSFWQDKKGLAFRDEIILQIEDDELFLRAFWACLLGGLIPIPLSVGGKDEHKYKVLQVFENLKNPSLCTDSANFDKLIGFANSIGHNKISTINHIQATIDTPTVIPATLFSATPQDLAFIQYSSGSTGTPKGVMLTHANLIANMSDMVLRGNISLFDNAVSWIPLTHDLGMIAFHLTSTLAGCNQIIMPTALFIRRPLLWMELVNDYKGSISYSPNFGFQYFLDAFQGKSFEWDLSSVRYIINGAEPISVEVCHNFIEQLKPLGIPQHCILPSYGMAEASVGVTSIQPGQSLKQHFIDRNSLKIGAKVVFSENQNPLTDVSFVNLGQAFDNCQVRICDENSVVQAPLVVGHIQIKGDNVTQGYYQDIERTHKLFSEDKWLKTGDLGFILEDGSLVMTGRHKNMIILNGQNYYPQDLERSLFGIGEISLGKVVICGVSGNGSEKEQLIVFVLYKKNISQFMALVHEIETTLFAVYGLMPTHVIPIKEVPKTTSGKVQHNVILEKYLKGFFNEQIESIQALKQSVLHIVPILQHKEEVQKYLVRFCKELLALEHIDNDLSFFEMGGNSLLATQLIAKISLELGVRLTLRQVFEHPDISSLSSLVISLVGQQNETITPAPQQEHYPLSYQQMRLWSIDNTTQNKTTYNLYGALQCEGELQYNTFGLAVHKLVTRHEILRTSYQLFEGEPRQVVHPVKKESLPIEFHVFDSENQALDFTQEAIKNIFNLSKGEVFKIYALKYSDNQHIILFCLHHIAGDGWSSEVILNDLMTLYKTSLNPTEQAPIPLVIQYKDYAVWQLNHFSKNEIRQKASDFWKNYLKGDLERLVLPNYQTNEFADGAKNIRYTLSQEDYLSLKKLANLSEGSLYFTLLSITKCLFHKYSGQADILVGTTVAGRVRAELRDQVGFFVNTLPVRTVIDSEKSFQNIAQEIKQSMLELFDYQDYPFNFILDDINYRVGNNQAPLFDVLVEYQSYNRETKDEFFKTTPLNLHNGTTTFDLNIEFIEDVQGITVNINYNSSVYDTAYIQRFISHFKKLISEISQNTMLKIGELSLFTDEDFKMLAEFNNTSTPLLLDKTIDELIDNIADTFPNNIAVVYNQEKLDYKTLNIKANKVAEILIKKASLKTDTLVGILTDRNPRLIEGVYGIWKSGGGYLPLHPDLPQERLKIIIEDAQLKVIIIEEKYLEIAKDLLQECECLTHLVCIDSEKDLTENIFGVSENQVVINTFVSRAKINSLAYAIYTSGSTGKPKGAMIEHGGLLNHVFSKLKDFELDAHSHIAQNASQSFDISVWQLFTGLVVGGTVVIYDQETILNPSQFIEKINNDSINVLELVPSYLSVMLDELVDKKDRDYFTNLKFLLVTGETVTKNLVERWFSRFPNTKVVNAYGPTEAADDIALYFMDSPPTQLTIPIGKPIQNMNIYIVDEYQQLCPVGVKGEVWVSGVGVGRGYVNDIEKTKEVFIENPFKTETERLYKTGDIGRFLPDGTIEFYGRKDYQVKIRGHRIELGEIEQHLTQIEGVRMSAVLNRNDNGEQDYLCAYVVYEEGLHLSLEYLKEQLSHSLPSYMIPTSWVIMEHFPLSANGKIDRKKLPEPQSKSLNQCVSVRVEPSSDTERKILAIWQELLNVESISIDDNFFEIGGHSLKATQMISKIYKNLEREVSIKDVFSYPTIRQFANFITTKKQNSTYQSIPNVALQEVYPLSNAQKRLWVIDAMEDDLVSYNSWGIFKIQGKVDIESLKKAVEMVVARHESLRTTFVECNGEPFQKIHPVGSLNIMLDVVDGLMLSEEEVIMELSKRGNAPMDISKGPLFQTSIVQSADDTNYWFCLMHHIICDGWSNNILVNEILTAYKAYVSGKMPELPALDIQYKDYANWQNEQLTQTVFEEHRQFWTNTFSRNIPVLNFPTYKERPHTKTYNGKTLKHVFSNDILSNIYGLGVEQNASLFMTLTALLNVIFYKYTAQKDIIIGTPTMGRNHPDLESQIGYYLNTLALRNQLESDAKFGDFLATVRETILNAFEHQDYPFDLILSQLDIERDLSRNPLFDVLLTLQNFDSNEAELLKEHFEDLSVNQMPLESSNSMFDMDLDFRETPEGQLELFFNYNTDIYEQGQIEGFIRHFEQLINQITQFPNATIDEINILQWCDIEIINQFNYTRKELNLDYTYYHYLEKFAQETPSKTAIICNEVTLNYDTLNRRVNQVARILDNKNVIQKDTMTGVFLERSEKMAMVVLSIWKVGGAYIPIERKLPDNRVLEISVDADVKAIITQKSFVNEELYKRLLAHCPVYFIEDLLEESYHEQDTNLGKQFDKNDLSFTLFTSGSTGKPKGALSEHIGMMNHALATVDYLNMDSESVLVQNASHAFDISVWQFFTAFITGGTTTVFNDDVVADPYVFLENCQNHRVSVLQVVPSYLTILLDLLEEKPDMKDGLKIEFLICCGEMVKPNLIRRWFSMFPNTKVVNDFGPAEASDGTSWYVFDSLPEDVLNIPIGRPIYNMATYIVDDSMSLCPIGTIGEICVAGIGVGRGYINDPARTQKVFMNDPFSVKPQRLYKTGDLGRYLPNGLLEFHGRKDYQVKINGQRIELGEIESKLVNLQGIKDALVLDVLDEFNKKYLLGFVILENDITLSISDIKTRLSKELPPYMIPRVIEVIDTFPLTPNGKTDRKALAKMQVNTNDKKHILVEATDEKQILLVDTWKKVLKRAEIGITDNFYDLGGDSISAIQIASQVSNAGYKVEIRDILRNPTIQELATYLKENKQIISQDKVVGEIPLSPIQIDFFKANKTNVNHYNQSILLSSEQRLVKEKVEEAFNVLGNHHDILRVIFNHQDNHIIQECLESIEYVVQVFEVSESDIENHASKLQASLNINEAPLMRIGIFRTVEQDYLFITVHHLLIDAVSWRILLEDFVTTYTAISEGQKYSLPPKTISYKRWAEQLIEYANTIRIQQEALYWKPFEKMGMQSIPYDFKSGQTLVSDRKTIEIELDAHYTDLLLTRSHQAFNTDVNDILLTALSVATSQQFGVKDLVIMLESHGRVEIAEYQRLDRTIGWFTSEYPVCINTQKHLDWGMKVKSTKENLHKVPNLGFGYHLLKYYSDTGLFGNSTKPQVVFNYIGKVEQDELEGGLRILKTTFGDEEALNNQSDYPLEVLSNVSQNKLQILVQYHQNQFHDYTISSWMQKYKEALEQTIDFCIQRDVQEMTPSDYDYQDLSLDELADLNAMF